MNQEPNADCDAGPIHLNLEDLHEKVEKADSRYCFPFDTATTKATLLLLIQRVRVAEREAERLNRQYDDLAEAYHELEASVTAPAGNPLCGQETDWPGQSCALFGGHPGGHLPSDTSPAETGNGLCRCPRWPTPHLPELACPEAEDTRVTPPEAGVSDGSL